ncbi:unnamed protein product [Urochloa decumbens]|uniref:F-box domain-containing protein n=1 Tax=Urochloa decumbens TaxID=240449 RepID=A0ABC9B4X5_9POAL
MPQSASTAGSDDLISALPDVLLHHVLGFLDAREAVRTCVLAKRWGHLWKSMPVLHFTGAGQVQLHRKFLDHLLLLRDRTTLEVCLLKFDCYVAADVPYVNLWIRHALLCQVRVLNLAVFGGGGGMVKEMWLDNLPVVSQYLTKLKLYGLRLQGKFLDFSSCQALQDLNMTECYIHADKISSRTLGHLRIQDSIFLSDCRTLISTPSVISLQVNDCWGTTALFGDMPLLSSATVTFGNRCDDYCQSDDPGYCDYASCLDCYCTDDGSAGCVVLNGLSAARNLELIAEPETFILKRDLRWCPTFSKLKTLLLSDWCVDGDHRALICILQHSPVLEMLTLQLSEDRESRNMVPSKAIYNLLDQPFPPEHLQSIKVKCHEVDQRVHNILKSLITYGVPLEKISIQQESKSSECFNFICTGFSSIPR